MSKIRKKALRPWANSAASKRVTWLSFLGLIILAIMICLCIGCQWRSGHKLNIDNYIIATETGYDGYGTVSFALDYEKMINDSKADADAKASALNIATSLSPFSPKWEETNVLKNGDKVEIQWEINESAIKGLEDLLGTKIQYKKSEHTISKLTPISTFDPFEYLHADNHQTMSGTGKVDFWIQCTIGNYNVKWTVEHNGENGKLSNGDTLTLTIVDDIDKEDFARQTGKTISRTTYEYTMAGLTDYVSGDNCLACVGEKDKKIFDQIVKDWVVSGLNDENIMADSRTFKHCGYLMYANDEPKSESMLIAIYQINDQYAGDYYIFIGHKAVFSYDEHGIYINNGESLPTSFIYYEKETVRYSDKFGWASGSEPMGFIHNNEAFAGHKKIEETVDYLEATYGKDYKHLYVGPEFFNIIKER
jgi:hypothetical protein